MLSRITSQRNVYFNILIEDQVLICHGNSTECKAEAVRQNYSESLVSLPDVLPPTARARCCFKLGNPYHGKSCLLIDVTKGSHEHTPGCF